MTDLLIKIFLKNCDDPKSIEARKKYGIFAGIIGIICNLLLFAGKLFAGIVSGSVAITADAFNNLSDSGSSVVTLLGFYFTGKAPDEKHPFGYGRFEYISGLIVSFIVIMVGVEFVGSSFDKIISGEKSQFNLIALIILLVSIAVKLWLGFFNTKIGKIINSDTMKAAAFDSISDVISTSVVVISLILSAFISFPIDGYLGIAVALFIIYGGFKIAIETVNPLLGQAPDPEMVKSIEQMIMQYDAITGVHDLIVHNYGYGRIIASLHAEIPAETNIIEAHEQIDLAEKEIGEQLNILLVIHLDPVVSDERVNDLKDLVQKIIVSINPKISMHDFRVVDGEQRINLIFDIVMPSNSKTKDEEIKRQISELLKVHDQRYNAVITVDRNYVGNIE